METPGKRAGRGGGAVDAPLRGATQDAAVAQRLQRAIHGFAPQQKGLSARWGATWPQVLIGAAGLTVLEMALILWPVRTMYVLGALLNLVFACTVLLRLYAVLVLRRAGAGRRDMCGGVGAADDELPVYSLLVPLYREARVVAPLIAHLRMLDYPRERLDIKLILEADDEATLAAARAALAGPDHGLFELVAVPPALPRTKPKALNYALEEVRGELVVVFDAEDRPEPDQLRKAVAAFARADERTICLQAALDYYNADHNWLTRQATIEFAALFRGLLPTLQQLRLPIPLGGTSNHFRTHSLRQLGGWDAFNVTEDADLGVRLARFGYRCAMLDSATHEEACLRLRDWLRQRTRWIKGWLQTYLVHMRRPLLLWRQLGARGFIGFQVVIGAQVLSHLAHPLFIAFMLSEAFYGRLFADPECWLGRLFWGLAAGNFAFGYLSSIWLGAVTLRRQGLVRLSPQLAFVPLYWLVISLAAYRAVAHYLSKPFDWEKTEHGVGASGDGGVQRSA